MNKYKQKRERETPWMMYFIIAMIWIVYIVCIYYSFKGKFFYSLIQSLPLLFFTTYGCFWYTKDINSKIDYLHESIGFKLNEIINNVEKKLKEIRDEREIRDSKLRDELLNSLVVTVNKIDEKAKIMNDIFIEYEKRYIKQQNQWEKMIKNENKKRDDYLVLLENKMKENYDLEIDAINKNQQKIYDTIKNQIETNIPKSISSELDKYFDWKL